MFGSHDHAVRIDDIDVEDIGIIKVLSHGLLDAKEVVDDDHRTHDRKRARESRRLPLRFLLNERALPYDEEA